MSQIPVPAPAQPAAVNPVDRIVSGLLEKATKQGRGFVLDLAANTKRDIRPYIAMRDRIMKGDTKGVTCGDVDLLDEMIQQSDSPTVIEVRELPPVHDEWQKPARGKNHVVHDPESLARMIVRYGTHCSTIFVNEDAFVMVVDDYKPRGDREFIKMVLKKSPDYEAWVKAIELPAITHRQLMSLLLNQEHNLVDGKLLHAVQSVKATATVNIDSDMTDNGDTVGVILKTAKGEDLARFPKSFSISVPVFDIDRDGPNEFPSHLVTVKVGLEVIMPTEPGKPVLFRIRCHELTAAVRERLARHVNTLKAALAALKQEEDQWLIVNGTPDYHT